MQPKVMVVDDDPVIRALLEEYFCALDYHVQTVEQPRACLVAVRAFRPDILLLDFQMPEVNGLQILKMLRADNELKNLPVVMLSANSETAQLAEEEGVSADEYVLKPFDVRELREVIERMLGLPGE